MKNFQKSVDNLTGLCYNNNVERERKIPNTRKGKKMDKMTVKELMELLKNYDENKTVEIMGGEDGNGSWAELSVGNDAIMEYGY